MPYTPSGFFCDRLIRERERRDGEGTLNKPLRFNGQDFGALRQECLQRKSLFEDESFPATVESLGFKELGHKSNKVKNIVWKRPKVGAEGDGKGCWVAAELACGGGSGGGGVERRRWRHIDLHGPHEDVWTPPAALTLHLVDVLWMLKWGALNFNLEDVSRKAALTSLCLCRKSARTLSLLLGEPAGLTSAREIWVTLLC